MSISRPRTRSLASRPSAAGGEQRIGRDLIAESLNRAVTRPVVAIVGVGLIGGSLGMALRRRGYRVVGIGRRKSSLANAKRAGAVDSTSLRLSDAAEADLVILAAPVADIVRLAETLFPRLKRGTLVTDVGSVKGSVMRKLVPLARKYRLRFAGSHPLAGSHRTGVNAARRDLFHKSACVVVPGTSGAITPIAAFWRSVGAHPIRLTAKTHDAALALTSHLPHLIAHALVQTVARRSDRRQLTRLMAGSFRDVTRVASADPEQWSQIFSQNAVDVRRASALFSRELRRLSGQIGRSGLQATLRRSQSFRQPLFNGI